MVVSVALFHAAGQGLVEIPQKVTFWAWMDLIFDQPGRHPDQRRRRHCQNRPQDAVRTSSVRFSRIT